MSDKPKYYGKSIVELMSETQRACDKAIEQYVAKRYFWLPWNWIKDN